MAIPLFPFAAVASGATGTLGAEVFSGFIVSSFDADGGRLSLVGGRIGSLIGGPPPRKSCMSPSTCRVRVGGGWVRGYVGESVGGRVGDSVGESIGQSMNQWNDE
jgi:hypothetical protein